MIYIPFLFLVIIWIWPAVWFRFIRDRLEINVTLQRKEYDIGESIFIDIRVRNLSWMPCPFIGFSLQLPKGLSASEQNKLSSIDWKTYLLMRQEVTFQKECFAYERGIYNIKELYVKVNEGFGLRNVYLTIPLFKKALYIRPNPLFHNRVTFQFKEIMGTLEQQRWLYPDESLLKGIREYRIGDSYKHVAWQATAKSGKWMTKEYSSSTEAKVVLVLNAQSTDSYWEGIQKERFDRLCGLMIGICSQLERMGSSMDCKTNAVLDSLPNTYSLGHQQTEGLRSLLARANPLAGVALDPILEEITTDGNRARLLIVFSTYFTPKQLVILQHLRRQGTQLLVVSDTASDDEQEAREIV